MSSCCFLGHRNAVLTSAQQRKLSALLQYLIVELNVDAFAFGSRSTFNSLCHKTVTALKQIYPHISRKAFTCSHETCTLQEDVDIVTLYRRFTHLEMEILPMDEEIYHQPPDKSSRYSYILRNRAMVDYSQYCVFFYDKSNRNVRSGTAIAYRYAISRNKLIYNIAEM